LERAQIIDDLPTLSYGIMCIEGIRNGTVILYKEKAYT